MAEFTQSFERVTGTILTPTGDHRFLAGEVRGDELYLSRFDGASAYLYRAKVNDDGALEGEYWSGKTGHQRFRAERNPDAVLDTSAVATALKDPAVKLEFTFPDLEARPVSLSDPRFQGKVVIVTLAGSWCANCHDEAAFLAQLYRELRGEGLEVVSLIFKHFGDFAEAAAATRRFRDKFGIEHETLIAGDPVVHLDADEPVAGLSTHWAIYLRPGLGRGAAIGGLPLPLDPECELDPYGPSHADLGLTTRGFDEGITAAASWALGRFDGGFGRWSCSSFAAQTGFTPASYPVVSFVRENVYAVLDSNHGFKMLALGKLDAAELDGGHGDGARRVQAGPVRRGRAPPRVREPVSLDVAGLPPAGILADSTEVETTGGVETIEAIGTVTLETVRVEEQVPAAGRELGTDVNALEAGLKSFISFSKGCYIGQEAIARLDTYKKLRTIIALFAVESDSVHPPAAGQLFQDGREAGRITSTAYSPLREGWIGLGFRQIRTGNPGYVLGRGAGLPTVHCTCISELPPGYEEYDIQG